MAKLHHRSEMKSMLRIAFDMDDVLADTHRAEVSWLTALRGAPVQAALPLEQAASAAELAALEEMMQEGRFFADLPVMPNSQQVLRGLTDRYEIFIATAAMEYPRSFAWKFAWLERHFPFIPAQRVVFCGDKSVVHADFLVDDTPRHFSRFRGQGIVYSAPHNTQEQAYPRVNDWREVERLFLTADSHDQAPTQGATGQSGERVSQTALGRQTAAGQSGQ
jgi:5'(3')-deoxyribonucleotidase